MVKQYYLLINILSKMLRGSHQSQLNKNHNQSALVQRICTCKVLEFKQYEKKTQIDLLFYKLID